jgi:hypothetical protein
MGKIRQIIVLLSIGYLTLLCLSYVWQFFLEKKVELQRLKSPNHDKEAVLEISESGSIYLNTKINEKVIDKGFPIYSGTDMFGKKRRDFVEICPTRKWLNDRVLFFGFENYRRSKKSTVHIKNESSKIIDQFEVNPCGKYIVYDIQPNEIVSIPVEISNDEISNCFVSGEGIFADGVRIPLSSNYFDESERKESKSQPCGNVEIVVYAENVTFKPFQE